MDGAEDFHVRFWGVRGSIACGGPETARYGGNTSTLEIRCGSRSLVFDAGTGLRQLGHKLMPEGPLDVDIFLTHTHYDHVCGLPFFVPFFDKRNVVRIHAGHLGGAHGAIHQVLCQLMMSPLFPVPPSIFPAKLDYLDFECGATLEPHDGITIRTCRLSHPDQATGYRVEFGGRAICYVTDTEHKPGGLDPNILALIAGADIMIYDSMFSDEEHKTRVGWGHSTWNEGMRLCDAAGVKTFVAFHHDPDHDDDFMDKVAAEIAATRPGSVVAREGMILRP